MKQRSPDSITTFGPISQAFVLGEVKYIVFPPWRMQSFASVENEAKFQNLMQSQTAEEGSSCGHSRVFTSDEIQETYGHFSANRMV